MLEFAEQENIKGNVLKHYNKTVFYMHGKIGQCFIDIIHDEQYTWTNMSGM